MPAGNDLFNHQVRFLTELHPALLYVYQLGIFVTFFGTIYGAVRSLRVRTAFESLMPISAAAQDSLRAVPAGHRVVLRGAGPGIPVDDDRSGQADHASSSLVGGVFSCGLWCLAMLWTDHRFLPQPLRMPPVLG